MKTLHCNLNFDIHRSRSFLYGNTEKPQIIEEK